MDKHTYTEKEIFDTVIHNIRQSVLKALFEYDFQPNEEMTDEAHDIELIRLYRSLFQTACNAELFDMIDAKIRKKFKVMNKE
jgi:hypothetical protein